ncbi:hypothetical protein Hbl1158_13645 [Halobaculum sp. CBA1158]|uniref:hypothetical protein n=1 Tax=Halobaculum sp. CBA1158 TaxID=2904243 RepID=UPI001F2DB837|nr:hypothetical protein [Halobaculum sp. CBA1158]UIO99552.1 hypothetical protein Hbl1158_13645 [Halobaculum sp. CBA1158]
MAVSFEPSDRLREAAGEWADQRMMEDERALEVKVEQALLEIEHLVSGGTEVTFELEDGGERVRFSPSDDLETFLERQAEESGLSVERLLRLHVDLFANVFLDEDAERPPNAPPTE